MLCQTNGGAVKRESIVRKSKKDILRMLSPYLSLIALIGAPRSDAASGFPPGRGWLLSNRVRKERAAELRNTRAFPDEKHSLATAPVPEVPVARSKLAL